MFISRKKINALFNRAIKIHKAWKDAHERYLINKSSAVYSSVSYYYQQYSLVVDTIEVLDLLKQYKKFLKKEESKKWRKDK